MAEATNEVLPITDKKRAFHLDGCRRRRDDHCLDIHVAQDYGMHKEQLVAKECYENDYGQAIQNGHFYIPQRGILQYKEDSI